MQNIIENDIIFIGFVGKGDKEESVKSDLEINMEKILNVLFMK